MLPCPMRYLLFISLFVGFTACSSAYRHAQAVPTNELCVSGFVPRFERQLYNTHVDVAGRHLSGLLLLKTMPDSSTRLVFANEAGFKFFDFGYKGTDFQVYYIIEQMNKKAVIKTLQKDFSLLLMRPVTQFAMRESFELGNEKYSSYVSGKDFYHYITDRDCTELLRMERSGKKKKVTAINFTGVENNIPDSVHIQHFKFNFVISLKQLRANVEQ